MRRTRRLAASLSHVILVGSLHGTGTKPYHPPKPRTVRAYGYVRRDSLKCCLVCIECAARHCSILTCVRIDARVLDNDLGSDHQSQVFLERNAFIVLMENITFSFVQVTVSDIRISTTSYHPHSRQTALSLISCPRAVWVHKGVAVAGFTVEHTRLVNWIEGSLEEQHAATYICSSIAIR